jgi:hypothetical protein
MLALIVWYSSRVLLSFHDVIDEKLNTPELLAFSGRLEAWFPRILGALCILPLAFFLADVGVKTYVLNSPLLIVAAFAALAAIDGLNGCLRCKLYRWGFASSMVFVCLSHRWGTEVPYPQKPTFSNLPAALFKIGDNLALATTGFQLVIAIGSGYCSTTSAGVGAPARESGGAGDRTDVTRCSFCPRSRSPRSPRGWPPSGARCCRARRTSFRRRCWPLYWSSHSLCTAAPGSRRWSANRP